MHDIQVIHAQMWRARATWAHIGQVLWKENVSPVVAARFYQAIIQTILLYGSKSWVISWTAMAWREGFHICATYRMAKANKPKRGSDQEWIYPRLEDVMKECDLKMVEEYISIHRQTIVEYVSPCQILDRCRQGEQKRGAIPCHWWWEQPMDLDVHDANGSGE